jgi:drug/metabolite transporter (DMT)-like permease
VLTALVATLGAAFYGFADFYGGLASRRDAALVVTITAQATGLVVLGTLALIFPPASWTDPLILWGVGAGLLGGTGVLSLYAGLATGRMSVVAPITAALSGALPAAVGLSTGARPSWVAMVGMVLALCSVVIVSVFSGEDEVGVAGAGQGKRALGFAVIAGVGFGLSILCWAQTPASTGFAPLVAARVTSVTVFSAAAMLLGMRRLVPVRAAMPMALLTGVLDAAANLTQVTALRMGPLALASVLGALYPVATVLLARYVLHERLRGWQRVGIAMALVAVALTAWPG